MAKYIKDPFPAISHLVGVLLSIAGLFTLIKSAGQSQTALIGCGIFGSSLVLLYLASTLTHAIHCSAKVEAILEKCDYAAIFLLIAGTYTPICILIIKGSLGWCLLIIEWFLALTGIINIFFGTQRSKQGHVLIYLIMGWLFLLGIPSLLVSLTNPLLGWLIGGGLFYSVGSIFFIKNWPTLFKGYFTAHDLWHLCVLGGSVCHFMLISFFISNN